MVAALLDTIRAFQTPEALVQSRLALAADVAGDVASNEPVVAALVVGSTALRRCSADADLDLVLVTPAAPGDDRFSTRLVDGVRVELERIGRREALLCTGRSGWVWELREAARLGTGIPVLDPGGFGQRLARRAEATGPPAERYEATLRDVYLRLIDLAGPPAELDWARRTDALRGCLDNLVLLALLVRSRRYQKPKWALADLLHAGEDALADAVLAAYGIHADDAHAARQTVVGAHDVVARSFEVAGVPPHAEVLAMGYAPEWAEASYVSRTLGDAEDLAASGRPVEAQYVAKFAARLAAGVLSPATDAHGIVDTFGECGLADRYLDLFDSAPPVDDHLLDAALASADDRRRALESARPAMPA